VRYYIANDFVMMTTP